MKIAIIGSRGLTVTNLQSFLPTECTEIVSGGAKGIDECAAKFANENGIPLTVFLPEYNRYGRGAPLKRNLQIIEYADEIIAFWDGSSRGTKYVIDQCKRLGKPVAVHIIESI